MLRKPSGRILIWKKMTTTSRVLFNFFVGGLTAALLTACGGGGSDAPAVGAAPPPAAPPAATLLGTFTDAPVAGAKYVTSSGSGGCVASSPCTTDAQGQFNYAPGDAITFSAAGVTLGTTPALKPATDGSTMVTPVTLVSGATLPSEAGPTAIAQLLQTLSNITAGTTGSSTAGILTMPADTTTMTKLTAALGSAGVTAASSVSTVVSKLQTAVDSAFGANLFTVVPASAATAALTQGLNSNGIVGTVWTGACTCGGSGVIYFQPGGTLTGFTDSGDLLSGTWAGSTTDGSGVTLQISSSGDGYGTGSIPAGSSTGTATIYTSLGVAEGVFSFNKIVAPTATATATASTQYLGGWYATYTPNAAAILLGDYGGTAYIIAAPDGTFHGVTESSITSFSGTWTAASGQGSASWTEPPPSCNQRCTTTIAIDLAKGTGTVAQNGVDSGTLSFSRTGTLNRTNNSGPPIPLALNLVVSWANTGGSAANSLSLGLAILDATGMQVANTSKSVSTAPRYDGVRTTTTDTFVLAYPQGNGATYKITTGPSNCAISGSSASINDANSGNAEAYPTVYVTCDPNSAVEPIPMILFVKTTWGTSFPKGSMPGYGLSLTVKDASGLQIASGFAQQGQTMSGSVFTVTSSIAAAYPAGGGATYTLTTGSAYCSITSGGSGVVSDVNKSNAAAYPTVTVSCP